MQICTIKGTGTNAKSKHIEDLCRQEQLLFSVTSKLPVLLMQWTASLNEETRLKVLFSKEGMQLRRSFEPLAS